MRHLQSANAPLYRDAILHFCLYQPLYDPQCEPEREQYAHDLIMASGELAWYRERIWAALRELDDELEIDRVLGIAVLFARDGDAEARQVVYVAAAELCADGSNLGAYALIELDGWDGFVWAAERLGESPALLDDDTHFGAWNSINHELGEAEVAQRLAQLRQTSPAINAYVCALEADEQRQHERKAERVTIEQFSYEQLKAFLIQGSGSVFVARRWARHQADAPWQAIADDILTLTNPDLQAACLRVFIERPFPLGFAPLLPLLAQPHERLAQVTVDALASFQHPAIRQQALALIAANHHVSAMMELLGNDYQLGDHVLIEQLLIRAGDDEALHNLGLSLLQVADQAMMLDLVDAMLYVYEHGPCSICRSSVVDWLLEMDALPKWARIECAHDAHLATRAAVDGSEENQHLP